MALLRRHGVSARGAVRAVKTYQAQGLLDDHTAARLWADHWARQGYAWVAIRAKLAAKGFPVRAVEAVAQRLAHPAEETTRARQLVAQQLRAGATSQQRSRLARRLSSRGFDSELIETLLGEWSQKEPSRGDAES